MDKKYITLFKELAQATAASAEMVMDYDREKGDEKGLETATAMRDDYEKLKDAVEAEDYVLTKSDAARLLVAAMIQVNQLQDRINNLKMAMVGYQDDVVPKLQSIVDASSNEEAAQLADEKFVIVTETNI